MKNNTKTFNSNNLQDFSIFLKTLEQHIVDGGSIIFPEMKWKFDVSAKFAKSKDVIANTYLTEIPKTMEAPVVDPLSMPYVMIIVPSDTEEG